jgi:hypothetical protein
VPKNAASVVTDGVGADVAARETGARTSMTTAVLPASMGRRSQPIRQNLKCLRQQKPKGVQPRRMDHAAISTVVDEDVAEIVVGIAIAETTPKISQHRSSFRWK